MCDFLIKIREIERETFFTGIKCYLFASEQIRNLLLIRSGNGEEKNGIKILSTLNKIVCHTLKVLIYSKSKDILCNSSFYNLLKIYF